MKTIKLDAVRARQKRGEADGRLIGVGVATYTEQTAHGTSVFAAWGIPLGSLPLSFEGYLNYIAAKGKNEFGGPTKPETNIDAMIMYDASSLVGAKAKTFRIGLEYQYWRNKYGIDGLNESFPNVMAVVKF